MRHPGSLHRKRWSEIRTFLHVPVGAIICTLWTCYSQILHKSSYSLPARRVQTTKVSVDFSSSSD
ncbi:uncharacterized protein BDV17DRAFT_9806 [Aspergillus undulatus]|uniref:uncharacterized protein n=1 Tax=Aspergillus undulatus TaxID=1810928 RepID=UPI003CCD1134